MFGLNAKDAQGMLEDVALLKARQSDNSSDLEADLWDATAAMKRKNRAIKVRDSALDELKGRFQKLGAGYSDLSAIMQSQREVIDSLADQLAAKLGVDAQEVRQAAYKGISKRYDARIGNMLTTGELTDDPRKDPEVMKRPTRDWYIPGL